MNCPHCNAPSPEQSKFCASCGAKIDAPTLSCVQCGAAISCDAKFCSSCGRAVGSSDTQRGAHDLQRLVPKEYAEQLRALGGRVSSERRIVTILFLDVTGSTAMAETLDPEDVLEIMNAAFEVLVEPICRYGGTLARLTGDGVLAFFGAPIAHEDDADRACRAALEIVERARNYGRLLESQRGMPGFNIRVGINTGLVVVGEVGSDLRVEYTAMGDAVNVAARMEAAADPGTIYLTETTQRLVATTVDLVDLGPIAVKGKSAPVHAFRLVDGKSSDESVSANLDTRAPFTGRQKERLQLEDLLRAVSNGSGDRVLVVGPAGSGKTRLVREAQESVGKDVSWTQTGCTSFARDMSYWNARELVLGLAGISASESVDEVHKTLRSTIRKMTTAETSHDPDELFCLLAHLLNLPLDLIMEKFVEQLAPEELRRRTIRAVCELAELSAARQPLVLVWDDVQWIDPSSSDILEAIAQLCNTLPILVVVLLRSDSERVSSRVTDLWSDLDGQRIEMGSLASADAATLLQHTLGDRRISKESSERILDAAGGNPLFIEEVARSLIESAATDSVVDANVIKDMGIPSSLSAAVVARVDALPPIEKQVLQTACVLGRVFRQAVLALTVDSGVVATHLETALTSLCRRGFLHRRTLGKVSAGGLGGTLVPADNPLWHTPIPPAQAQMSAETRRDPGAEFFFEQPLTAEVAYRALLKSQRRELHRRVGEAMESVYADGRDELAPILAHHFDRGGMADRAHSYWVGAARTARRGFNNIEAVHAYRQAIGRDDRLRPGGDPVECVQLQEELGDVFYVMSEYERAIDVYNAALENATDRTRLLRKKGQVLEKWGKHDEALAYFESAFESVDATQDKTEAANVYSALGLARYHEGQVEEAISLETRAHDMMAASGNERGVAQVCNNLGIMYCKHGDLDEALAVHERALLVRTRLHDAYGRAASHNNIGLVRLRRCDYDKAISHFEQSLALFEELDNRHGQARAFDNLGEVYEQSGDHARAMDYVGKAVAILAEISKHESTIDSEMWQSGSW